MIPLAPQLLAAIIVASVAFFSGWTAQGWHRDSKEKDRVTQELVQAQATAAVAIRRTDNVIQAQNAAASRAANDRHDAAGARSELERVRSLSEAAVTAARASHEACIDRTTALSDVFQSCSGEYEALGAKATRHVNDIQTLNEAWPK